MHFLNNPLLMRQVIMDHYEHPRNKRVLNHPLAQSIHMDTSGCIDDIHVHLLLKDNVLEALTFDGVACTISTASTSIMTELLTGKTIEEARLIIENYVNMIYEKPYDASVLGEAVVFMYTYKQASRIKCATLGWTGLQQLLKKES
jgi:nitrogen fixation protein NifU and related proteins